MNIILDLLESIQYECENCSMGGVGKDGPTQKDLDDAIKKGHPIEHDSNYHSFQQIWLYAEKALKNINNL